MRILVKGIFRFLVYIISSILVFLGIIFMISVNLGIIYFLEGVTFMTVGVLLIILNHKRKPVEIKQTLEVTGPVNVKEIHCPVCGATVDPTKVEVITGKPYVTCSYCDNKFELTEEPTW
jgi:uncharacterized Zn-finger protein